MAKSIMTQPTLFTRLGAIRATVAAASVEIRSLRKSMNRKGTPDPGGGSEVAEDLYIQLGSALEPLDMAIDYMTPTKDHVDQPIRKPREVTHA